MAIEVWTCTITYDGARFVVNDRAHPHGAHDVGVAPWSGKGTAVPCGEEMDEDTAADLYECVVERARAMAEQLAGAWGATQPLF